MRVTGGQYRGRTLHVPKGRDIRPTSDKVRQAIYNSLASYGLPHEAHIIDCFCGTGAMGIEGLSRGARSCFFVDQAPQSMKCTQENLESLELEDRAVCLIRAVAKIGKRHADAPHCDLAFIDPPYGHDLAAPAMAALAKGNWLADHSVCVVEEEKGAVINPPEGFELFNHKSYGDTEIHFYKYVITPV